MKRAIFIEVIIVLVSFITEVSIFTTPTRAGVTLQFWSTWASEYVRPTVEKIVANWNKTHPDVQVVYTPVSAQIVEKFKVAVAAKKVPDVIAGGLLDFYDPAGKPRAEIEKECPFAYIDKVADARFRRDFYDDGWRLQEALYQGYIGFPVEMNAEVMFYNKDLFKLAGLNPDRPPRTIDQFYTYISKITSAALKQGIEKYGYIFEAKDPTQIAFLETYAGPLAGHVMPIGYMNKSGEYVFTLADSKNVEGLEKLYRIPYQKGWTPKVLGYDYMTARAAFGQGLAGFYRIGAYMMVVYNRQYPELNYGITDLPRISSDGTFVAGGTGSYLLVTREEYGGHPKEAMEFAKWYVNAENQALHAIEAGKAVPNRKAYNTPGIPDYLINVRRILDSRMRAQEKWKQKQISAYPDVKVVEIGGLKMVMDNVPAQVGGGQIIYIAGGLMQEYLEGRISAQDMLVQVEREWANILRREGIKVNDASIGWNTPAPAK